MPLWLLSEFCSATASSPRARASLLVPQCSQGALLMDAVLYLFVAMMKTLKETILCV